MQERNTPAVQGAATQLVNYAAPAGVHMGMAAAEAGVDGDVAMADADADGGAGHATPAAGAGVGAAEAGVGVPAAAMPSPALPGPSNAAAGAADPEKRRCMDVQARCACGSSIQYFLLQCVIPLPAAAHQRLHG